MIYKPLELFSDVNKINFSLLIFLILLLTLYFYTLSSSKLSSQQKPSLKISQCIFEIEEAKTDQQKAKGLSGRDKLNKKTGMLFIFHDPGIYTFWMNEMKFNLDFVWILDNKVVDIDENVPPFEGDDITRFSPTSVVDKILEINAGEVGACGIKIGDITY